MDQTTQKMADTTKELSDKTTEVNKTSEDLDVKTEELLRLSQNINSETNAIHSQGREGATVTNRKDMLKAMEQSTTVEKKIAYAGQYFQAFEFQVWGGSAGDDQDRLETLYNLALQEFFREAREYLPEDYATNPKVDPTSTKNQDKNMYALAVTMHLTNDLEQPQLIDPSNPDGPRSTVSMYDLLQRGLSKKADNLSGKIKDADLKDWQREVLNDELAFEYLIRVRENFLPVMTLAGLSDIAVQGPTIIPYLLHVGDLKALWKTFQPWQATLPPNPEQLVTLTKYLNDPALGAFAARAVLDNLGVDKSMNDTVVKLFKNMKMPSNMPAGFTTPSENLPSPVDALKQAVADLIRGN
jgi:hypothetical protein